MAQCAAIVNLNGQAVVAPVDLGGEPCTSLVLMTPAEYSAMSHNPFVLSNEDGLLLSASIVGVWAAAWAIRMAVLALGTNDETP